jgi:murein hydrolase activator
LVFFLCGMALQLGAQTREELEQDKQAIEREIRLINDMLKEAKQTTTISLNHLAMISQQINSRESLLRNIRNEIALIDTRIKTYSANIAALQNELTQLREAYAKMIQHAYNHVDATRGIMFILSSESFNQAYLRFNYFRQYARHRQLQAQKIGEVSSELAEKVSALESERSQQQALLSKQRQEISLLSQEKTSQDQTVKQLQQKERDLLQRLRQQERAARELQNAIERVIAEELRRAQELARTEGRVTTDMFALTPEERILSANFAENRGSLLWPVERGIITGRFGEQPHPVLRGIRINNNGVEIATFEGARARSIFNGEVSRVISVPGGTYAVIVRHGEYLSVYSNLAEVLVKNGDKIAIRQELGVVSTSTAESKTQINLQIWKGNEKLNPELWIARQR